MTSNQDCSNSKSLRWWSLALSADNEWLHLCLCNLTPFPLAVTAGIPYMTNLVSTRISSQEHGPMNVPLAVEPPTPPHYYRGTEFELWVPLSLVLVGGWQEDPKEKGTLTLEAWCSWVVVSWRIRHQQEKHSSARSLYLLSDSKKLIFPPRIVIYFQRSFRSSWSHQVVDSLEDVMLRNPFDFSSWWTYSTGSSES
jgi:hypothetical protein